MFSELAGIDRAAPGFDKIPIAPRPTGRITHASGAMNTRHGRLACVWEIEGEIFTAEVTIPPNTTADITLPVSGPVLENGKPLGSGILTLGSGTYQFSATRQSPTF